MGKFKPKAKYDLYYMSIHFGVVIELDRVLEVRAGEKTLIEGDWSTNTTISVDEENLFGGPSKQGGFVGDLHLLFGEDDQELSEYLALKTGRTFDNCPGYRGFFSIFFTDTPGRSPVAGAYWQGNSPFLPPVDLRGEKIFDDWYPETARVPRSGAPSQQVVDEVGPGQYDLTSQPKDRHVAYDFAGRRYFYVNAEADGFDYLHEYTMEDNTLVKSTKLEWDASVDLKFDGFFYINGKLLTGANLDGVNNFGSVVLNPADGALLSSNDGPRLGGQLNDAIVEDMGGGDFIIVRYQIRGISAFEFVHYKFSGGVFTYITPDINISSSGANFIGSKPGVGSITYYYRDLSTNDIIEVVVNGAGDTIATQTHAVAASAPGGALFYLKNEGTVLQATGLDVNKFSFDDALFTPIWSSPGILTSSLNRFPHISKSKVFGTIGLSNATFSGDIDVIDIATGQLNQVISSKTGQTSNNSTLIWDGPGGAMWYTRNGNDHFRWQGTPESGAAGPYEHNPVHLIRTLMTHPKAGATMTSGMLDDAAFRSAALTCYNEGLGVSILWTRNNTRKFFIQEILDHIEAVLFDDKVTGLSTIKMIRNDYVVANLPRITRDNAELTRYSRKAFGETVNEMQVTFTNHENEEEELVTLQDAGNIAQQNGQIISDSRNYYGIRTPELAMDLARRDLRAASYPIASMNARLFSEFDHVYPSMPVLIEEWVFPNGATIRDMVVRVVDPRVDHVEQGFVECVLTEDVWGLPLTEFDTIVKADDAAATPELPSNFDYVRFFTLPYMFTINLISSSVLTGNAEPDAYIGIAAAEEGGDTSRYDVQGEVTDTLGNTSLDDLGENSTVSRSTLPEALIGEATSTLSSYGVTTGGDLPVVGHWLLIDGGSEALDELCIVTSIAPLTIRRGMLDTTPKAWPEGQQFFILPETTDFVDENKYAAPDNVDYRLLPYTSLGRLDVLDAIIYSVPVSLRPYLPTRPADVVIDGVGFGTLDASGLTQLAVSWANRNRLEEDSLVEFWDSADVTGEPGQTTIIQALDKDKVFIAEDTGIAGTSANFDVSNWAGADEGYIRVLSERSGKRSLQGHDIHVQFVSLLQEEPGGASGALIRTEGGDPIEL